MKLLFEQCLDCGIGLSCYEHGFTRCPKIEKAGEGLGIPVKQKDDSYIKNMPFGVFMCLKHLVTINNKII